MTKINFTSFVTYLSDELKDLATECYEAKYTENEIKFKIFRSSGDYIAYLNKNKNNPEEAEDDIVCNLIDAGGLNNSDVSIDTYLQLINLELLCKVELQEDVSIILNKFTIEHRNKLTTLEDHYAKLNIPNFPTIGNKFKINGYEKVKMELTVDALIYDSAFISNDYVLTVNGYEVKYKKLDINRTNELTLHNVKNTENKFYQNSSTLVVSFDGIFIDEDILDTLYNDSKKSDTVGKTYTITFGKSGETDPFDNEMYIKNIIFNFAYEQLVTFTMSLQLKATI